MNQPAKGARSTVSSTTGITGMSQSQITDISVNGLHQAMLEKDQQISNLQGIINRLELKNKQYSSYQEAVVQYQQKYQQVQADLLKVNERLRAKNSQCQQVRKKLQQQLKQKKQRATQFVRHEDYMKVTNQYKKFRQVHRNCQASIKQMQQKTTQVDSVISQLKQQISSLQNIITTKNSQINQLKLQKYNIKSNQSQQSIQSQRQLLVPGQSQGQGQLGLSQSAHTRSSSNIISSFRVISGGQGEGKELKDQRNYSTVTEYNGQTEKLNQGLVIYGRENDQLRKKIHKLEQEIQQLMAGARGGGGGLNSQFTKIVQQYQAKIASMMSRLTMLHRLEMENNGLELEKRNFLVTLEELKQQLASKNIYCESLEKRLRQLENLKGVNMQSDIVGFMARGDKIAREVERLEKTLGEKIEIIKQLKKKFQQIQVTEQTFRLMDERLTQLQQKLKASKQQLKKQQDRTMQQQQKCFKIQKQCKRLQIQLSQLKSQMAKTNRLVSQKVQKIELQSVELARLEKQNQQKKMLSEKVAKLQVENRRLEKDLQNEIDSSNELAMTVIVLSAQIQRGSACGNISRQFIQQFESLKTKAKQTEIHAKFLEQRVKRLEHLHKQVVQETVKVSEHLHNSHKRWNHYDTAMERLIHFLQTSEEKNKLKYDQLDANISNWLQMQDKRLKELAKDDPLGDIDAYVKYDATSGDATQYQQQQQQSQPQPQPIQYQRQQYQQPQQQQQYQYKR